MKILTKSIKIYFSLFLLSGCTSVKEIKQEDLYGKYQWYGFYGIARNITLKEDNTFVYNWQVGLGCGTTKGKWKLEQNNLILNSEKQPDKFNRNHEIRLFSLSSPNSDEYKIKILDIENEPLDFVFCELWKDTMKLNEVYSDTSGICVIPVNDSSTTIKFNYIGFKDVEIELDTFELKTFSLEMKREVDNYEYFTNTKWKIKNGRIIDRKIKRDKYVKTNYYEKVE